MKAARLRILHVVGARPNFMKAAPVVKALSRRSGVSQAVVHTGQHYDDNMSDVFFRQLGMPDPDINLDVGSGTHARQTAEVMIRLEPVLLDRRPDRVMVYGDVNSTLAAALVCSKLLVPVAHVEAGLRSFDRTMPEEINRLLTDQLADLLFIHSEEAAGNLVKEGVPRDRIVFAGNTMIDTLVQLLDIALKSDENQALAPPGGKFALVTLHRPALVDNPARLQAMLAALCQVAGRLPVIFPMHPRTRGRVVESGAGGLLDRLTVVPPLGYLEFLALEARATVVITDSGGVQEETTYLGVPCLTVRENTERPVTVRTGTNTLAGYDTAKLIGLVAEIMAGRYKRSSRPRLWDGKAAERIADALAGVP